MRPLLNSFCFLFVAGLAFQFCAGSFQEGSDHFRYPFLHFGADRAFPDQSSQQMQIFSAIAPQFDPNASIRRNAAETLRQRVVKTLSPGNLFSGALEVKDLLQRLPARLNRFFDALANNEFKVSVDAIDEKTLIVGFQKIANRITVGLIIAALIVGAALLMRVETNFRILGYPGFAIIFFLCAAGAGIVLLLNILFYDKSKGD